jgi:hypothetical protein
VKAAIFSGNFPFAAEYRKYRPDYSGEDALCNTLARFPAFWKRNHTKSGALA